MNEEIRELLDLSDADLAWFERLRQSVLEGNRRMNLTRVTEPRDFYVKHVLDSLQPFRAVDALRELPDGLRVADLGSGAGFPGFVIARLRPAWEVVLIERTQKKAAFLEETRDALDAGNVYVVPLDAREAAGRVKVLRRGCDLVLARAVGRVAAVTKAAAPLLARGGVVVHYKGARPDTAEIEEGARAAEQLGWRQEGPFVYDLPPDAQRSVVLSRAIRRRRSAPRPRTRATRKSRGGTGR